MTGFYVGLLIRPRVGQEWVNGDQFPLGRLRLLTLELFTMLTKLLVISVLTTASVGISLAKNSAPTTTTPQTDTRAIGNAARSERKGIEESASDAGPNAELAIHAPCDENCQQGRQNISIQRRVVWFTFGLVIVGFLQVATMIWQTYLLRGSLRVIGRQVDLMRIQADFQATAMRQWLDVRAIKVLDTGRSLNPVTWSVQVSEKIEVCFEAINRTPYPLTFQKAYVLVTVVGIGEEFNFRCNKEVRLIPGGGKGSKCAFLMKLHLGADALRSYSQSMDLLFTVTGNIQFLPALGPHEIQEFDFLINQLLAKRPNCP